MEELVERAEKERELEARHDLGNNKDSKTIESIKGLKESNKGHTYSGNCDHILKANNTINTRNF